MTPLTGNRRVRGFSLLEMIVATWIFTIVIVAVLTVFEGAGRFNKASLQTAELQQSLRGSLREIERTVRMAGVGGLPVTQAVLAADPVTGTSYNNVAAGYTVTDWATGRQLPVRRGTDVIEVRGVIRTRLFALTSAGCYPCVGVTDTVVVPAMSPYAVTNNSASEFQVVQGIVSTGGQHLFVVSSQQADMSIGGTMHNVGMASAVAIDTTPAQARVTVNFQDASAKMFNGTVPYAGSAANPLDTNIRGGVLDDIVYFIDDTLVGHPALVMGLLKGVSPRTFQILPIAEDIEDLQVAFGIDGVDGTALDGFVGALYSPLVNKDEWAGNVAGETAVTYTNFYTATGPRLRSMMLSVVSKAAQADVAFLGHPNAFGIFPLDSAATAPTARPTNRKAITMRINLRNFNGGN